MLFEKKFFVNFQHEEKNDFCRTQNVLFLVSHTILACKFVLLRKSTAEVYQYAGKAAAFLVKSSVTEPHSFDRKKKHR